MSSRLLCLLASICLTLPSLAQSSRPIPYPVLPPPGFQRAIESGTRLPTGEPGPKYWTNTARYRIEAELLPDSTLLRGKETVVYKNNSPNVLRDIRVHLLQNIHREDAVRNMRLAPTGGIRVHSATYNGSPVAMQVNGTVMTLTLSEPLEPGKSAELQFAFSFRVPDRGARMGHVANTYYLAYWYPQVAVYDDVDGWNADQYMGYGEFYMGYADYDVSITLPHGYLVTATGELKNDADVLSPSVRERLRAVTGTRVSHIVAENQRGAGKATVDVPEGKLTWHFTASNVRDFAFGASPDYIWDATLAGVGDRDGDGRGDSSRINAFYRPEHRLWANSASHAKFAIEFMSREFLPYPWPHMTTVEGAGIMGGGMEYPMLTLIGSPSSDRSLFGVTAHEVAHMWFPMIVGTDEKQIAWVDEGFTSYNTALMEGQKYGEELTGRASRQYEMIARSGREVEMMRHVDETSTSDGSWSFAAYNKPQLLLRALRGLYGDERFFKAYRAFAQNWAYKHPTAYDFFNTVENTLGEDLDWFWTPFFFETWTLDQAVAGVNASRVTVEDRGLATAPTLVQVTYEGGRTQMQTIPVSEWLSGKRQVTLQFPAGEVQSVTIDPEAILPDIDRGNNRWEK